MRWSLKNKIRRCCPLLGTFVEVTVEDDGTGQAHAAIDAAFAAVRRVHHLMSFHELDSEISRLNRWAVHQKVAVSPETYQVLQYSQELHERSSGVFDIAVAVELIKEEVLPNHPFLSGLEGYAGTTSDIELLAHGYVCFRRPLCIDVGGIAKGFAVDQAVEILQKNGIKNGIVNAGGDMRCFGDQEQVVWVRHPKNPGQLIALPVLRNAALATSANSYKGENPHQPVCAQIHGRTRHPVRRVFSVSVRANFCWLADGLTKVVLALEKESLTLLAELNAAGFIIYPNNRMVCYEGGLA